MDRGGGEARDKLEAMGQKNAVKVEWLTLAGACVECISYKTVSQSVNRLMSLGRSGTLSFSSWIIKHFGECE